MLHTLEKRENVPFFSSDVQVTLGVHLSNETHRVSKKGLFCGEMEHIYQKLIKSQNWSPANLEGKGYSLWFFSFFFSKKFFVPGEFLCFLREFQGPECFFRCTLGGFLGAKMAFSTFLEKMKVHFERFLKEKLRFWIRIFFGNSFGNFWSGAKKNVSPRPGHPHFRPQNILHYGHFWPKIAIFSAFSGAKMGWGPEQIHYTGVEMQRGDRRCNADPSKCPWPCISCLDATDRHCNADPSKCPWPCRSCLDAVTLSVALLK